MSAGKLLIVLGSGLLVAGGVAAETRVQPELDADDAVAVVQRTFANLYGFSSIQHVEIRARMADGRDFVRSAQVIRRGADAGLNRMLIRFLEPEPLRGTGLLLLERENYQYDSFLYQPIYDRIRRISIAQRHDKVFGTELAFEDLEVKRAAQWDAVLLREEEVSNRRTAVIELKPKGVPSGYEKMIGWFDRGSPVLLRLEFYRKGERLKELEVDLERIEQRGRYIVPMVLTFRSANGSSTAVELKDLRFIDSIPDSAFALSSLQQGDAASDRSRSSDD